MFEEDIANAHLGMNPTVRKNLEIAEENRVKTVHDFRGLNLTMQLEGEDVGSDIHASIEGALAMAADAIIDKREKQSIIEQAKEQLKAEGWVKK